MSRKKRKNKIEKMKIQKNFSKLWLATILGLLVLVAFLVMRQVAENEKFPWEINWEKPIEIHNSNKTDLYRQVSGLITDYKNDLDSAINSQNPNEADRALQKHHLRLAALAKSMGEEKYAQDILAGANIDDFCALLTSKLQDQGFCFDVMLTSRNCRWGQINIENMFIAPILKVRRGKVENVAFTIFVLDKTLFVYNEGKSAISNGLEKIIFIEPQIKQEATEMSANIGRKVSLSEREHIDTVHELQHLLDAHRFDNKLSPDVLEARAALKTLACKNISKKIMFAGLKVWRDAEDPSYNIAYRALRSYLGKDFFNLPDEDVTEKATQALKKMDQEIQNNLSR